MKTLRFYGLCLLSVLCSATAWAYDFEVDGIYYKICSTENQEVAVTHGDWDPSLNHQGQGYSGDIVLPATIKIRNREFKVTTIGHHAFENCTGLTSIDLKNVTYLGVHAFAGCTGLTSIDLKNVTNIGGGAFESCTSLTSVDSKNVTTIGWYAFQFCTGLTSIDLGNVTNLGGYAFYCCTSLTSLELNKVTTVEEYTFRGCSGLTSIELNKVTTIGENAFGRCTGLTSIDLNKVTSIGMTAFEYCTSLKQVHLRNVKTIGESAFGSCDNIELVKTLEIVPPTVGKDAFTKLGYLATLEVPAGGKEAYKNHEAWKNFYEIVEAGAADQLSLLVQCSEGGYVYFASTNVTDGFASAAFNTGEKVELKFETDRGYELQSVVINGKDVTADVVDGGYTVTMDAQTNVVVTFGIYLTIQHAENGKVNLDVEQGKTYTFTVLASKGWKINTVTFNGVDVTSELGADHKYTTPAITASAVLNVSFETDMPSGVEDYSAGKVSVRGYNGNIIVDGADRGEEVRVYTMNGALVTSEMSQGAQLQLNVEENKVYIVKVGQRTFKLSL